MEECHKEMHLLSQQHPPWPSDPPTMKFQPMDRFEGPSSPDLQLSISVSPSPLKKVRMYKDVKIDSSHVEDLKWRAAEQIRLAAMEKAYAERVRELTRREMELAQSEFARAHKLWERAREEVERAEKMKETADCMEITCHSCRNKFKP